MRLSAIYLTLFVVFAYADMESTIALQRTGAGFEANPAVADSEGQFDKRQFLIINSLLCLLTTFMLYWALRTRRYIPDLYLKWPLIAARDLVSVGVSFMPFKEKFRGRAAFMYLSIAMGFTLIRPIVVASNLMIVRSGRGFFDGLAAYWSTFLEGWMWYAALITTIILPVWLVATLLTAGLLRIELHRSRTA